MPDHRYKDLEKRRLYVRNWARESRKKYPERHKKHSRNSYKRHRENRLFKAQIYGWLNKDRIRERLKWYNIKKFYGLTQEEYEALGPSCGVCGSGLKLNVDHDHSTGKVRGKLCHSCNTGIGLFKDSVELLHKAAAYLGRMPKGAS